MGLRAKSLLHHNPTICYADARSCHCTDRLTDTISSLVIVTHHLLQMGALSELRVPRSRHPSPQDGHEHRAESNSQPS